MKQHPRGVYFGLVVYLGYKLPIYVKKVTHFLGSALKEQCAKEYARGVTDFDIQVCIDGEVKQFHRTGFELGRFNSRSGRFRSVMYVPEAVWREGPAKLAVYYNGTLRELAGAYADRLEDRDILVDRALFEDLSLVASKLTALCDAGYFDGMDTWKRST
jgi:hypothetical protein